MVSTSGPKLKLSGERAKREANRFKSEFPYFMKNIKSYGLNTGRLVVPIHFAKRHLQKRKKMRLLNEKGEIWSVKLVFNGERESYTGQMVIYSGWKTFAHENHLKLGDYCVFELVTGYIMQVHIYKCSSPCGSSEDSGFSDNYVSHGDSSSLSRGVASLSSSEGSCFIVEGSGHSSVSESPLGGPRASSMDGLAARMKSKCKKAREGSNGGHSGPVTCGVSRQQAETSSHRGAVSAPGVGVQGVDIGSQAPKVVGASVAGGAPWCDMGVALAGAKDGGNVATGAANAISGQKIDGLEPGAKFFVVPKASPRLVMSYDLEIVEGFPVCARYAGLYKRICSRHGHLASSDVIKLMPKLVVASVTEALEVIGEIEACAENELLMGRISDWETCLGAMEAIGLQVGWVQCRLKELSDIVGKMDLVKEARVAVPRLAKNVESAEATYKAAKIKLAEAESTMAVNDRVLNHADNIALTSRLVFHGLL